MSALAISIATDEGGWFTAHLPPLVASLEERGHTVTVVHQAGRIPEGDIALLLSLGQLVPATVRQRNRSTVVVHGSALPAGKGWSPITWQILEGATSIPMTLFEAVDRVDAGRVFLRGQLEISPVDLVDEIRAKQAEETARMCVEFVDRFPGVLDEASEQATEGETFYARRGPADSRLDPSLSLAEQFDLIRVSDPEAYPAFFDLRGHRFTLKLERLEGNPHD